MNSDRNLRLSALLILLAAFGLALLVWAIDPFYLLVFGPVVTAGFCHYWLWGRSATNEVTREKAQQFLEAAEAFGRPEAAGGQPINVTTAPGDIWLDGKMAAKADHRTDPATASIFEKQP